MAALQVIRLQQHGYVHLSDTEYLLPAADPCKYDRLSEPVRKPVSCGDNRAVSGGYSRQYNCSCHIL